MDVRHADVLRELDELRREVAGLRTSRSRLVVVADAERRGFERALHDGVQQMLVTLAASLELAAASVDVDPVAAKRLLEGARVDVQRALEETRKLAERIYPPLIESGGLSAAIRSAAANARIPIRIDVDVGSACPPEIAGTVYVVCLDVLDRSDAGSPVVVSVRGADGSLAFEVVADGEIDEELPSRDRVEALEGRMTIREEPGRRTRVTGSLPLKGRG